MPIVGALDVHRRQITFRTLELASGESRRGRIAPVAARQHAQERRSIGDRARHRTCRVLTVRDRYNAGPAHEPECWLDADKRVVVRR